MKRATTQTANTKTELDLRVQPVRFNKIIQVKKVFTLALIVATVLTASAQLVPSILNLRMSDNAPFKVIIDGRKTTGMSNTAKLVNLKPGQHALQIYKVRNVWGQQSLISVFNGMIMLTANAESWATVYPEMQKIKFDDIRAFADPNQCRPNLVNPCHPKLPVHERCETETPTYFPQAPVGPVAMCGSDFNQLKQTIGNAGFENTRLSIFKQALPYNYFTTTQVRELMDLFWFEGTKLDVAKLAYDKTIDQNNYYLVNNEFSFSGSVDDLGNYIAMR